MTVGQVKQAYQGKEDFPCPITEKLIKAGYQQKSGGYIKNARKDNTVEVDYTNARPTQYWHLFKSYFEEDKKEEERKLKDTSTFPKSVSCGELIFWMAEVLGCVDKDKLEDLCDDITEHPIPCEEEPRCDKNGQTIFCRAKWNKVIKDLCFDKIVEAVENMCAEK